MSLRFLSQQTPGKNVKTIDFSTESNLSFEISNLSVVTLGHAAHPLITVMTKATQSHTSTFLLFSLLKIACF